MMRRKILFALGVVVLIITLFGLCGMLWAGMMLPGDNGKTSFGIYPAVPYPVVGLLLAFGLFALGAVKKGRSSADGAARVCGERTVALPFGHAGVFRDLQADRSADTALRTDAAGADRLPVRTGAVC